MCTGQNPADILSRGMSAKELVDCYVWWQGPYFLLQTKDTWADNQAFEKSPGDDEMRRSARTRQRKQEQEGQEVHGEAYYTFVTVTESVSLPIDSTRYSSWLKIKRILSWVNRFIDNCQRPKSDRTFGELIVSDFKRAEIQLIRHAQCMELGRNGPLYRAGDQWLQVTNSSDYNRNWMMAV